MIKINRLLIIVVIGLLVFSCGARKRATKKSAEIKKNRSETSKSSRPITKNTNNYIAAYKDIAVAEMKKYGIPASITLAQGILESGSGKGRLAVKANNHFGIKCHNWKGRKIYHDDDKKHECFRKYKNPKYSYRDHSEFLAKRKRYANLFKLDKDDYKAWARGLRRAGYATDKKYPQKLISLIERYKLYKFDNKSRKKKTKKNSKYTVKKGDTLYSISKKYNIPVQELQELNGLEDNTLSIGQVLEIKHE